MTILIWLLRIKRLIKESDELVAIIVASIKTQSIQHLIILS